MLYQSPKSVNWVTRRRDGQLNSSRKLLAITGGAHAREQIATWEKSQVVKKYAESQKCET
jgi:hypothetical protein